MALSATLTFPGRIKDKKEIIMLRRLTVLLLIIISAGCSQKGEVGVRNRTSGGASVDIDGRGYYLHPGDLIVREFDIGERFVFGPDDTRVRVSGEGDYVFYFDHMMRVRDEETNILPLYCEAGQLTVTNNTSGDMHLYIAACSDPDWGSPCDYIHAGGQVAWKLSPGCWDILLTSPGYSDITDTFGNIMACEEYSITLFSAENPETDVSSPHSVRRIIRPGDKSAEKKNKNCSGGSDAIRREKVGKNRLY